MSRCPKCKKNIPFPEQHGPISTRERDGLLGVAAPGLVALHAVRLPAQVTQVFDAQGQPAPLVSEPNMVTFVVERGWHRGQ